jgi:ABC-type transport system involved in multi-copper enzyme maturation permease subunit
MTLDLTLARRMAGAEFLMLRKKRSLLAWSAVLAAGTVVIYFVWAALRHQAGTLPVGGTHGFARGSEILGIFMGPLAAVLIGAEAGAGDSAAGVFRDLVVTGRSRTALFFARIPGALALCTIIVTLGYVAVLAFTFGLAGSGPTPSLSTVLQDYGWAVLVNGAVCLVALGLASLTLSRPATIATLIGLELVASPILLQSSSVGNLRKALLDASVLNLAPALSRGAPVLAESIAVVVGVMVAWVAVALGLGAWRTRRVDA